MMESHFFTAGRTVTAAIQRSLASLWLGVSILIAGPVHAQTTGTIPVWVDPPTQTLGDSSLVQCGGDGTSVCIGPGNNPAIGQSSALMGFTGSAQFNDSAVYGEATSPNGVTNGVVGINQSGDDGATGVFGWAVSTAPGLTTGIWGRSSAPSGRGVVGEGGATAGDGVAGFGFFGVSGTGVVGVFAQSTSLGGVAVVGQSVPGGTAAEFDGFVRVSNFDSAGTTSLCWNVNHYLSNCSSSLRYKTEVRPFSRGLDIVKRLRPIVFRWKEGGMHDIGLGAEDVEQVEPRLTFRNDKGEIEGVKYNQLSAVFVNAITEQQTQIARQQAEIDALKGLVCQLRPDANVCQ